MNIEKFPNAVTRAVNNFSGQHRFAKLLEKYGTHVHRQTIFNWCKAGRIPHQYSDTIKRLVKDQGHNMQDPKGLLAAIRPIGGLNGTVDAPNAALEAFIAAQGGIPAMLLKANELIKKQNDEAQIYYAADCRRAAVHGEAPPVFEPLKKWTYVMVHNWLKRGRVSTNFQQSFGIIFNCPQSVMEMPSVVQQTVDDILGD